MGSSENSTAREPWSPPGTAFPGANSSFVGEAIFDDWIALLAIVVLLRALAGEAARVLRVAEPLYAA